MKKRVEIKIFGEVQGVFFRQETKRVADDLGLVGWVRNVGDGTVEIAAEGEEEKLQKLIEWAKIGTKYGRVEKVKIEWRKASGEFKSFEIL